MKHAVLYVPGLGDTRPGSQQFAVNLWRIYGVRPEVVLMQWSKSELFESKLVRLLNRIDELYSNGYKVSLVGASAGASAVVNAFAKRQTEIHRVVCICGILQRRQSTGSSIALETGFTGSVHQLAASFEALSSQSTQRILSIRPLADQVVAPSDTMVFGAQSLTIPTVGHTLSIGLAITLFSALVVGNLKRP